MLIWAYDEGKSIPYSRPRARASGSFAWYGIEDVCGAEYDDDEDCGNAWEVRKGLPEDMLIFKINALFYVQSRAW